jgi:thioredoxin 1
MGIIEVTDKSMKKEVLSEKSGIVLVDFLAPWCRPCKLLSTVLDDLKTEVKNKVKIVKVNVEKNPKSAHHFHVMSLPTLILFKNGKKIDTKVGFHSQEDILHWLKKHSLKRPLK